MNEIVKVASGVSELDSLLDGLYIGDNVVWHDDSGSLASVFYLNFIQISQAEKKPVIYVSFDRSPKNLFDKLGPLADSPMLTVLDCFTCGKGAGSPIFLKFYEEKRSEYSCQLIRVENPQDADKLMDILYDTHATMEGDVRLVFESLTGMQELWGGEEHILNFYVHSCPRLYELNTIAYWIMEKLAHSPRLRAQINRIAQVAIDLSVKRGTTSLTILKAEKRNLEMLNKPCHYWSKDLNVSFDSEKRAGPIDLGPRLKELRTRRGLSQKELAKLVGVTSSSISQVEGNLIYPSLPALIKMAEVLSVKVSSIFRDKADMRSRVVFPEAEAGEVRCQNLPERSVHIKLLIPADIETRAEPYLIEIPQDTTLPGHFFIHKGEETGYLLSGKLEFMLEKEDYTVQPGDVVCLTSEIPVQWKNPGPDVARLLWIKVR